MSKNAWQLAFVILALALAGACSKSDFAARNGKQAAVRGTDAADGDDRNEDLKNGNKGDSDGNDDDANDSDGDSDGDSDSDGDGDDDDDDLGQSDDSGGGSDLETEDETIHKPAVCSTTTIKFAPTGTESKCPAHYAAYTADDSREYKIACCPLPARDILSESEPVERGQRCESNEIATGASASGLICTKINTKRYKLDSARASCYVGDGASGGQNATPCGTPSATLQAMVATFGSDACIGNPFGSLIVGRTGKYCRDVTSSQLQYKDSGAAVKMFK